MTRGVHDVNVHRGGTQNTDRENNQQFLLNNSVNEDEC